MKRQELIEVLITVNAVEVRVIFSAPPTLEVIIDAVTHVFKDNEHVREGICKLLASLGDSDLIVDVGDRAQFTQDDKAIGDLRVQPRTLFENSEEPSYYVD